LGKWDATAKQLQQSCIEAVKKSKCIRRTVKKQGKLMDRSRRIVAVGLLTEHDLFLLGEGFRRVYRLDEKHDFGALLAEIDAAERKNAQAE
jgi:hypothetical protein